MRELVAWIIVAFLVVTSFVHLLLEDIDAHQHPREHIVVVTPR